MSIDVVERIEAIPLRAPLAERELYGSARSWVRERTACLVKLTTAEGVIGWGEAFGPPEVVARAVLRLGASAVGTPVSRHRPFVADALSGSYHLAAGGAYVAAVSGIDIALWDAWGKSLGVSVSELLGGRIRDRVSAYASSGFLVPDRADERLREDLETARSLGYSAVKIKVGRSPREDVERARIAREILGPDGVLMVDFNGAYTAYDAIRVIERMVESDVAWFEEPVPVHDREGLRLLSRRADVASGEAVWSRHEFRELFERRLIGIAQPDVAKCGGLTETAAIGELARTAGVPLSPHCWSAGVAQAATLQILASEPDSPSAHSVRRSLRFESDLGVNPLRDWILVEPIVVEDGIAQIPSGPGLGVEVDESAISPWRIEGLT